MKKSRQYTKEFKQEAVKLALQRPSIAGAAKDLGVPMATLHTWVSTLKDQQTSPGSKQEIPIDVKSLLEENRRLHKENGVLREEKEILKKAATCVL